MATKIQRKESEDDEAMPFRYSITSYGADFAVDGVVSRMKDGGIFIPPFQRSYVWKHRQASKFIESLLLGLPVPGVFLARESEERLVVIDGQQRLKSLRYFCEGYFIHEAKPFPLRGVVPQFEGKSFSELLIQDRRRLLNSIIHATVVRQDQPTDDQSSIYFIFERLNTGGIALQPQEIRASIYYGPFQELLVRLNDNVSWRNIYGQKNKNLRDQELVLRFFALYQDSSRYERPMKDFLNRFMGRHRRITASDAEKYSTLFVNVIEYIDACLDKKAFRINRVLNAAVFDAVTVGLARRLERGYPKIPKSFIDAYNDLIGDGDFLSSVERATADNEVVHRRLQLATDYLSKIR